MGQSVSFSVYPRSQIKLLILGYGENSGIGLAESTYVHAEAWKNCAKLKSRRKAEGVVTRDQPFPITMFWYKTLRISEA